MRKKLILGLALTSILLGLLPINIASASIAISSPSGETYERGDTVTISATTYSGDTQWVIQIKGTSVVWMDNVTSGSLSYSFQIPSSWSGGTYTVYIDGDQSAVASTTFRLSVPYLPPIVPPTPAPPTAGQVEAMSNAEAVATVKALSIQEASTILTGITTSKAVIIVKALNRSFVEAIFEAGINAGNTIKLSAIANALDEDVAGDLLLDLDPDAGADLVEAMVNGNLNAAARRVEQAVKRSGNEEILTEFGGTLTGIPAATLVSLFREIVGLPATPSTVAELFEVMSITKVIDIIDAWMDTEDYEGLTMVFSYLSDEKLEEIYLTMSGSQRTTIYPYIDSATQARLPDQEELTVSNLSIEPETVELGEVVTISVTVTNDGLIEFTEGITLKVDAVSIESEMVTLMPDESETITWTVSEATPGTYSVEVNGLTGSFTVESPPEPVPANIIYNSIGVSPTSVEAGDPVTVTVTLENTGELSGIESVELAVNGEIVDIKDVTVAGGDTKSTTFTVTEDEPGTYTAEAGGKSATFTVNEPPPPPAQFPYTYVVIAVVLIAVAAYIYMQQQKQ